MANEYPSMLDLAKRKGGDAITGLIEENVEAAPEFRVIPVRTIPGTTFRTNKRTTLPAVKFRNVNEGAETVKSSYAQDIVQTFVVDAPIEVDTALIEADEGGDGMASILADEASGVVGGFMLTMGSQFYYGTGNDTKGFQGLEHFVSSLQILDATGTTAATGSSVYFARVGGKQGVKFVSGNRSSLRLGRWMKQQVTRDSKKLMAMVNNLQGWVGLTIGHPRSVGRIYNLTEDSGKGMTDALASDLLAKFPVGQRPTHCFMTKRSVAQLQKSRTAISQVAYQGGAVAPWPTEVHGIPIVETDQIKNTEAIS